MSDHDHHDSEASHERGTLQTRRSFLRSTVLGAAASWTLPAFIDQTFLAMNAQAANSATQIVTGTDEPILVVLQQAGGNDGLNMLPPWADDAYHAARPTLGHHPDKVLKLNDYCGLHPSLTSLKGLYDEGHLAVVQGVGYPNPNRSHFRSTEIWQTASDADKNQPYGWLGSYFDSCCQGAAPTVGVTIGGQMPQAFNSPHPTGVSFANPEQYRWIDNPKKGGHGDGEMSTDERYFRMLNAPGTLADGQEDPSGDGSIGTLSAGGATQGSALGSLDFLERTALDAQVSSDQVLAIARKTRPGATYPAGKLADSLSLVARMIAGGLPTRVYYVSHGGYDTHQNQAPTHERLMKELGDSLGAFCADLKAQGNFDRVMVITFSEFGRRVAQNASGGTDHGAAAPLFMLGGGVKPGLYGKYPSLTDLYQGDVKYNVDFRSVYATALERWLKVPSQTVLGRKFPLLPVA